MRTYGLSEREAVAVISAARLTLIRLKYEQPDYQPLLGGTECALEERVAVIALTPVVAYVPPTLTDEQQDQQDAVEELSAFERSVAAECYSYVFWK